MLHLLVAPALLLLSMQSPPADLLDAGLLFTGPVAFKRAKKTTEFTISDHGSILVVQVDTERGFSVASKDSVSYHWSQLLAHAHKASIRMADMSLASDSLVRPESYSDLLMCISTPAQRMEPTRIVVVQCIAFDQRKQWISDDGRPVPEIVIVAALPNHGSAEEFLARRPPEKPLYVRLEPIH